jgi:lysozyme family protein
MGRSKLYGQILRRMPAKVLGPRELKGGSQVTVLDAAKMQLNLLWSTTKIEKQHKSEAEQACTELTKPTARAMYETVERWTGYPWQLVAALHWRESTGNFASRLQDGKRLPAALEWMADASATLLHTLGKAPNPISNLDALDLAEKWNGEGYRARGMRSPYVWAATNHQECGKFIADGQFNPLAWDGQLGVAALLLILPPIGKEAHPMASTPPKATQPVQPADSQLSATLASIQAFLGLIEELTPFARAMVPTPYRAAIDAVTPILAAVSGVLQNHADSGQPPANASAVILNALTPATSSA